MEIRSDTRKVKKLPPFVQYSIFPLTESFLLGAGFTFCDPLLDNLPAFTVCAVRYSVAAVVLLIYAIILGKAVRIPEKECIIGGVLAGVIGAAASGACYTGQMFSGAGKTGFIISMYVFFVPILDLLRGRKVKARIWVCEGFILVGLALLCLNTTDGVSGGDILLLISSLLYAIQVMVFDKYLVTCEPAAFTCVMYIAQGVLAAFISVIFEVPDMAAFRECIWALILVGIVCSAIPYTIGAYSQQGGDVTKLSILWSTESVFSVLCAAVILRETMSLREILGCIIVFTAVVISYIDPHKKEKQEA